MRCKAKRPIDCTCRKEDIYPIKLSQQDEFIINKQYEDLLSAGTLINSIYKEPVSHLITIELQKALDHLTVAYKFYRIVLGLEK